MTSPADEIRVRRLERGDESLVVASAALFDAPPRPEWAARFLAAPGHHLLLAEVGGRAAGFVSAVEMTHPDKGTEMFLYELSVAPQHRRRGVATELVSRLLAIARERGCYDLWVLTDHDNEAALRTYRKSGATAESSHVMLTWPGQQRG